MDEQRSFADLSVTEVLGDAGRRQHVFMNHRTACVGCSVARFCNLRDVAATYGLDLEDLISELRLGAHPQTSSNQRSDL